MDSSSQVSKVASSETWISQSNNDDKSLKKEKKSIVNNDSPIKSQKEAYAASEMASEDALEEVKEESITDIASVSETNQDILDQMEGFSDFSKLVEVIRIKYVKEEVFNQLKSDISKIKFIVTQQSITDAFDAYIKSIVSSTSESSKKSLEKANEFRMDGNKYFKNKKYTESLKLYSRAILYAPCESPELPQLFANRSASLFHLNQFTDCLVDTQFALNHANYPVGQRYTLLLRKALCLKALNRTVEAQASLKEALQDQPVNIQRSINAIYDQFSLKADEDTQVTSSPVAAKIDGAPVAAPPFKSNGKLVNASDAVKLFYSEEKGHHLKATRNLNRDELIIQEKPYASILNSQFFDSFCQNCCVELKSNIYPCTQCCNVSYCSEKCQEAAWNAFHKSECNFLPIILSMGVLRLSMRILLVTGFEEALTVHRDLSGKRESASEASSPPFIRLDKDKVKRENNYRAIYTLCDPSNSLNYLVSSRQAIASAFMLHLLSHKYIAMVDPSMDDESYWTLGGLLLKHTHQISVNSIVLFHQPILPGPHGINGIDIRSQSVGTAIYATVSLMNHSCIPNTEFYYDGCKISVKSKCSINTGDEITCTYGPLFRKMSRAERMETLSSQYYFKCSCAACNDEQVYTKNNRKYEDNESNRLPILAECFICQACSGPMVINGSTQGKCLACRAVSSNLKELLEKLDSGKKLINVSKALLQFGRPSECEKNMLKAHNLLSKICWPTNRYMSTLYNELINIYTSVSGFEGSLEQGKKYIEVSNKIKTCIYGSDSFEYLHGHLQLLNLRWTQLTSNSSRSNAQPSASINKKLLTRLITESNSLITTVHQSLDNSKIGDNLLVLDSSVISCLKELVQLEKSVKQHSK